MAAIAPASVMAVVGADDVDVAVPRSTAVAPDAVASDERQLPECPRSVRPPVTPPQGHVDPLPPAPVPPAWTLLPPATCRGVADLLS